MRAPWTVLRDANTELRQERDELTALRTERIVLRTMLLVGVAGLILVAGWRPGGTEQPISGPRPAEALLAILVAVALAGIVAKAVALVRYGEPYSRKAKRADATRNLVLLPVLVPLIAALYWYMSDDAVITLTGTVVIALAMGGGLLARRWRYGRPDTQ